MAAAQSLTTSTPFERKIAADVRQQASGRRLVPVIVRLNLPVAADLPRGAARAAAIAAATDQVINRLQAGDFELVRRYRIVPIVAISANRSALLALAQMPEVLEVVLDRQDQLLLDRSTALIQANNVWPVSTGTGRSVAILDNGVDRDHPFVSGRVTHEACFRRDRRCPNGQATQRGQGAARNMAQSHGMHVAGIAAGARGVYHARRFDGVAPGAGIVAINVFTRTGAFVSDQIAALEYVSELREAGVTVVSANMSLGSGRYRAACDAQERERTLIIETLLEQNVATVIAAGNSGYSDSVSTPGCISAAVTVSSASDNDTLYTGQNRSSLTDLVAPGITIFSSVPDTTYGGNGAGDYASKSGTSMAAPHVAGAFALLSAAAPNATVIEILAALQATGRELRDPVTGRTYRRIDLDDALQRLSRP